MKIIVWFSVLCSVLMGFYMHYVFWGGFAPEVTFTNAIWLISLPSALYVFSQALPVATRPTMAVWLIFADWAASIFPISEVSYALWRFPTSTFQQGALSVWVPMELSDLLFFIISALLLRRSIGLA